MGKRRNLREKFMVVSQVAKKESENRALSLN
jgi:hypothetical protein